MSASRAVKLILLLFIVGLTAGGIKAYDLYRKAFKANVNVKSGKERYFYIPTNSDYQYVFGELKRGGYLKKDKTFDWVAKRKNYPNHIKPGRYLVRKRMSNNDMVNMLRSGNQEIVRLTFNNTNTIRELSVRIAEQLELSSDSLMKKLEDSTTLVKYKFSKHTLPSMFIPNTYEFYWNTSVDGFLNRMHREYENFWTKTRIAKAEQIGMTRNEVVTLASIVNKEVRYDEEKRRVAGLYMNRIEKGIKLQADPTLIYAMGDYSIRRVLNKHKKLDSPYNTYKYYGLPPGPICIPDIASIDAVLDYEKHDYIYMCARPDFSGRHNFAKTLRAHNKNAEAYRKELNKRRIYN